VQFAFDHPGESSDYVKKHAQEMNEEVRKKHIQLYVNNYSVDLGEEGKKAILKFIQTGKTGNLSEEKIFAGQEFL
jgi:1,4-dihydroxy-6-naphthoate synthase